MRDGFLLGVAEAGEMDEEINIWYEIEWKLERFSRIWYVVRIGPQECKVQYDGTWIRDVVTLLRVSDIARKFEAFH